MAEDATIDNLEADEKAAELTPLSAAILASKGIAHGFFTRKGGISAGIYSSLNCGRGSHDERTAVEENRRRVAAYLGVDGAALIGPRQAHTPRVVVAERAWNPGDAPEADAVVTGTRGLAISVLTADCAPILMADMNAGVIAAVHSGWKGAKAGVIEAALNTMSCLGGHASRTVVAIGPAISKGAYEVGPEFMEAFLADNPMNEQYFSQAKTEGRPHFDLISYIKDRLAACGVSKVQDIGICTYENESILFSHRRSVHRREPDYGRQISAILLQ